MSRFLWFSMYIKLMIPPLQSQFSCAGLCGVTITRYSNRANWQPMYGERVTNKNTLLSHYQVFISTQTQLLERSMLDSNYSCSQSSQHSHRIRLLYASKVVLSLRGIIQRLYMQTSALIGQYQKLLVSVVVIVSRMFSVFSFYQNVSSETFETC